MCVINATELYTSKNVSVPNFMVHIFYILHNQSKEGVKRVKVRKKRCEDVSRDWSDAL